VCLAVPGRIIERSGNRALVDFHGNRVRVNTILTPEAPVGSWVLVHAGFAISAIDEEDARPTWDYLNEGETQETTADRPASGERAGTGDVV